MACAAGRAPSGGAPSGGRLGAEAQQVATTGVLTEGERIGEADRQSALWDVGDGDDGDGDGGMHLGDDGDGGGGGDGGDGGGNPARVVGELERSAEVER